MRRCRKMISVIMLMVMLVSLLPSGAMAAEAPTGATNEVASVVEPQGNTDEAKNEDITNGETDKTEDSSADTSVSDVNENDPTEGDVIDVVPADDTTEETTDEDPTEGVTVEDAGLGKTSTEIAAEVEPTDKTVKKDEKAAGDSTDLIELLGNGVQMRVTKVVDGKDEEMNPPYEVEKGKKYGIHLRFMADSLEPGTYTATLPNVFTYKLMEKNEKGELVEDSDGKAEIKIDGIEYGYYTVTPEGQATIVLNEEVNSHQNIDAELHFHYTVNEQVDTTITFNDEPFKIIDPIAYVALDKDTYYHVKGFENQYSKTDDAGGVHWLWRTEAVHDNWTTPKDGKLVDEITSNNHIFTTWDIDENKIKVTAIHDGYEDITWKVDSESPGFTWAEKSWTYELPESMNGTTFGTGWTFRFDYSTTRTVEPLYSAQDYINWAHYYKFESSLSSVHDDLQIGSGYGSLTKAGKFRLDTNNRVMGLDYTIKGTIKVVENAAQYSIKDALFYYPLGKNDTVIPDSYQSPWEGMEVTLSLYRDVDGRLSGKNDRGVQVPDDVCLF